MNADMRRTSEPRLIQLDLTSQAFKQDPFSTLERMREAGPVVRTRLPFVGHVWVATTYEAVNDLLRDHHQFLQNPATAGNRGMGRLLRWLPRSLQPLRTHMLIRDEPDHRRLRSLVEQAFQRQSVEALRPRIAEIADEHLDLLVQEAARSPGGVDLIRHYTRPIPLAVICELLGLPPEDRPKFTRWASGFSSTSTLVGVAWIFWGLSRLMNYVRQEIQRQTQKPRAGLLAALIQAEEAGQRLSEDELLAMVFLLLAAGHETTLHQIAASVLALCDHPAERRELTADWSLADCAVQELLRWVSFAVFTKPRYAREDTVFHDQPIRRGEAIFACLASANMDPAVFPDPQRLDLHRQPNRHVAFGAGIHFCLGAKLARVETEIALERLFTRLPELRLATAREQVRYVARFGTRGLAALPVKW